MKPKRFRQETQLKKWCRERNKEGWPNKEMEHWAAFLRCQLWMLAHNPPLPDHMQKRAIQELATYAENLSQTRAGNVVPIPPRRKDEAS